MSAMTEVTKENMRVQQDRQQYYYDKKSRMRSYLVGDKVIILLPSDSSKLKALWKGPFTIIRKLNDVDYEIRVGGNKGVKSYHVNMLRKWEERHITLFSVEGKTTEFDSSDDIPCFPTQKFQTETWKDVHIDELLTGRQK